jgi:hypothetical protein
MHEKLLLISRTFDNKFRFQRRKDDSLMAKNSILLKFTGTKQFTLYFDFYRCLAIKTIDVVLEMHSVIS